MNAYKCDRCGKLYELTRSLVNKYRLIKIVNNYKEIYLDLCPYCESELLEWVGEVVKI